ncbi:TRAP transporter small permease subunit (plasmid) [Paroceanicella profunda]|uniref:TRAP transporter small permease protein n=1 Tax=Paroceanicella profunda TaxID=2579971 RepID=A0A5B8G291_9RHOB|nr:TRAP transporter small permease subunit [Paroceanicella profunda]QDL94020.1 TRAP transporter small permease subunit [Paroceanicella profunda]
MTRLHLTRPLDRAARALRLGATVLASAGFVVVVLAFAWTIFSRYVLGTASDGAEEIATAAYLWVVMLGAALAVRQSEHVAFDLLVSVLPPRAGRWLAAAGGLAAGLALLAALPVTVDYIAFLWREKTPALRIPLDRLYFCFPVFQGVTGLALTVNALRGALGREDGA